jgi:hypothetical protein
VTDPICFTTCDFFCPMTRRVEKICIRHALPDSAATHRVTQACALLPEIETCSGLIRCDVKDPGQPKAPSHWERCPLQKSLKTES